VKNKIHPSLVVSVTKRSSRTTAADNDIDWPRPNAELNFVPTPCYGRPSSKPRNRAARHGTEGR